MVQHLRHRSLNTSHLLVPFFSKGRVPITTCKQRAKSKEQRAKSKEQPLVYDSEKKNTGERLLTQL
jgi:hypothetical protein